MIKKRRYIWHTDTHIWPWDRFKFLNSILDSKSCAVFLTGDISNSAWSCLKDLEFLGKRAGRPIYFVLGNHDYHFSNIEFVHKEIRRLCSKYKNLIWLTEANIISLNEEVAIIGQEGWYDARSGNQNYLKYTIDWLLISEFRKLPSMKERIEKFQELANQSAINLSYKLELALENHKTVYLLTHFPCYLEANRTRSFLSEKFWEPYNTNFALGKSLETIMGKNKKRNLIILSGHTHCSINIHVSQNIECRVGKGAYHTINEEQIIII